MQRRFIRSSYRRDKENREETNKNRASTKYTGIDAASTLIDEHPGQRSAAHARRRGDLNRTRVHETGALGDFQNTQQDEQYVGAHKSVVQARTSA